VHMTRGWWTWGLAVLGVALIVHAASVILLPRVIMAGAMRKITARAGVNHMIHQPRPTAAARGVVRPSPDLLYSACVYDLMAAGGAVRVRAVGMPASYWSVSAFDADTNNFYVINDRKAIGGGVDLVLTAKGASPPAGPSLAVVSPTRRGIILVRTLIDDDAHLPTLDAARRRATCEPLKDAPGDGLAPLGGAVR